MIGVYKITNNLNGRVYIGRSINIENRISVHFNKNIKDEDCHGFIDLAIREYGKENFSWEVLEECEKEKLNEREIYYISLYDSKNPEKGYNCKKGGSPELNNQGKSVIDTDSLKTYESTGACARELNLSQGDIVRVCNHQYGSVGGFHFMYLDEYNEKGKIEYKSLRGSAVKKTVKCLETGTTYESVHKAAEQMGLNYRLICSVCNGKRKTTGGYHFAYV